MLLGVHSLYSTIHSVHLVTEILKSGSNFEGVLHPLKSTACPHGTPSAAAKERPPYRRWVSIGQHQGHNLHQLHSCLTRQRRRAKR